MEYKQLVDSALRCNVFEDQNTADSAVKAILGILASRMSEEDAREMSSRLPSPLSLDKLRHRQGWPLGISFNQYRYEIADQFHVSQDQAEAVICSVLHEIKEGFSPDTLHKWEQHLPGDWAEEIERA